jgi:Family of unknown function (DUF6247)
MSTQLCHLPAVTPTPPRQPLAHDAGSARRPGGTRHRLRRVTPPCTISGMSLERSGPSIRAVLAELAPQDLVEFEAEFRCALAQADDDFDLAPVQAVITRWWGRAHLRIHPPTAEERAAVARVAAGDDTGLYSKAAGQ